MEKNVDIIARLSQVVRENMTAYRSDFDYDVDTLKKAAREPKAEDRSFYWVSRPHGTWCLKEREVFLRDTGAYSIWTHYDTYNERFRAFRVVVRGEKGGHILGDLYPLNYDEHLRRVKAAALPIHTVTGQCADGTEFSIPYSAFKELDTKLWLHKAGGVKTIRYEPENEAELTARIMLENYIQSRRQRGAKKERINLTDGQKPRRSDR